MGVSHVEAAARERAARQVDGAAHGVAPSASAPLTEAEAPTVPTPGATLASEPSDLSVPVRRFVCSVRTMGGVSLITFAALLWLCTRTVRGQQWGERARFSLGADARAWILVVDPLTYITITAVAAALVAFLVIAVIRRRIALALAAVVVVAGANVTTQLFKAFWPTAPHYWHNSLPSGHSTVAMSVAIGAVLVAPSGVRRWLLPLTGFAVTFVGAGTIVGHWHRPGDVWAAFVLCLLWSAGAIGLLLKLRLGRRTRDAHYALRPALGLAGSVGAGLVFVLVGVRPADHDVHLVDAVVALSGIGLLAALVLAWVSAAADDNLG